MNLDAIDLGILRLLQADGRAGFSDLALATGRSHSAIRDRVAALQGAGYLAGYAARVDWSRLLPCQALVWASCPPDQADRLRSRLLECGACTEALALGSGRILVHLAASDMTAAHALVRQLFAGLRDVEVRLAMRTLVAARAPRAGLAPAVPANRRPGRRAGLAVSAAAFAPLPPSALHTASP